MRLQPDSRRPAAPRDPTPGRGAGPAGTREGETRAVGDGPRPATGAHGDVAALHVPFLLGARPSALVLVVGLLAGRALGVCRGRALAGQATAGSVFPLLAHPAHRERLRRQNGTGRDGRPTDAADGRAVEGEPGPTHRSPTAWEPSTRRPGGPDLTAGPRVSRARKPGRGTGPLKPSPVRTVTRERSRVGALRRSEPNPSRERSAAGPDRSAPICGGGRRDRRETGDARAVSRRSETPPTRRRPSSTRAEGGFLGV